MDNTTYITREVLEPCWYCDGDVTCEWCDGAGKVWRDRCYIGKLDPAQFAIWQLKMAG